MDGHDTGRTVPGSVPEGADSRAAERTTGGDGAPRRAPRARRTRSGLPRGVVASGRQLPPESYQGVRESEALRAAVAAGDVLHLRTMADSAERPMVRARALAALGDLEGLRRLAASRGRGASVAASLLAAASLPRLPHPEDRPA